MLLLVPFLQGEYSEDAKVESSEICGISLTSMGKLACHLCVQFHVAAEQQVGGMGSCTPFLFSELRTLFWC